MSIHEEVTFDKEGKPVPNTGFRGLFRKLFVPLLVVLVGLLGFGLGRLSSGEGQGGVKIEYDPNIISALSSSTPGTTVSTPRTTSAGPAAASASSETVYASSKGTKYYYSGCKNTISAANKISFPSASAAEAAGYTLASGCHK